MDKAIAACFIFCFGLLIIESILALSKIVTWKKAIIDFFVIGGLFTLFEFWKNSC